jgi:signal transduction histidine kinase
MKIRSKITLWVTGVGIITSLLSSLPVFLEMMEQPYRLIDTELKMMANSVAGFASLPHGQDSKSLKSAFPNQRYWVKAYDQNRHIIYRSDLTRYTDLPLRQGGKKYSVSTHIPKNKIRLHQGPGDEVIFRVRVVEINTDNFYGTIQIARPIEKLTEEIREATLILILGFMVSTLLLIGISYFVAGRILKPINAINILAREINAKTLDKRIPTGPNQDELHVLSSSLNHMFDRLQNSFIHQKQFIANASHELKTPITLLRLFWEEAVRRQDLPGSFQQQAMNQGKTLLRMERLVRNLLDLSALEFKETLAPTNFDLIELIQSVLEDFSVVISAENIHLETDFPPTLQMEGDQDMIRRLLINILDNAIKYNRENGSLKFGVEPEAHTIHITCFNTGRRIPAQELDRIFEKFYRVEKSRSLKYGGSGLGLAIARQIVRLHGGDIRMESSPDAWNRIIITLPQCFD